MEKIGGYTLYFMGMILAFFYPIKDFVITTMFFVIADTMFGVYKSVKLYGIKSLNSSKGFNAIVKTFFYLGSIKLAESVDNSIFEGVVNGVTMLSTKIVTGFIVLIEIKSLDETSISLGNKPLMEQIKCFIHRAKGLKKDLKEITKP